jgi:cytochrome c-type biogenesis protein CcmH
MILLLAVPILAQETPPIDASVDTSDITDDMVNEVSQKLYCPVCENIPLDTCGTAACKDWREEVRMMLASGMSEDSIIDNFVVRFGDRVVGVPKNPVLRAMSLITPWVMLFLGLLVAGWTILNWKRRSGDKEVPSHVVDEDNPYKDMLEQDLLG